MITDAKMRAALAYNAAADAYDAPPLAFWARVGRRTVERLALRPGASVLDACCGSGAPAIPAAQAAGAAGRVLGMDLAEGLLRLARSKARERGLGHAEFRLEDVDSLEPADEAFDAVICVFGIFFLADMAAGVRQLWRLVKPQGQLAITTWGPRVLEPGSSAFWAAVRIERPDLYKDFNPWDRISDPVALAVMMRDGGVEAEDVATESGLQELSSPADFWTIALGSGFRGTIEQLGPAQRERVRQATLEELSRQNVRSVEVNAIYAIARKATK